MQPVLKSQNLSELDNPIWTALTSVHAGLAECNALARRYPPTFTTLSGLANFTAEAFGSLAKLVPAGQTTSLFRIGSAHIPEPWTEVYAGPIIQMICEQLIAPAQEGNIQTLTEADVPEMLALAKLCLPGPFANQTIKFGSFIGIRIDNKLVAMTGERLQTENWAEVSAVCTHPDYRGKGLAKVLVAKVVEGIFSRSKMPFLHVRASNEGAIKSYKALGFVEREQLNMWVLRHGNKPT